MTFTESSTVEQMILDTVTRKRSIARLTVWENPPGWGGSLGGDLRPARWEYVPAADVPRQWGDAVVYPWLREALINLNPEIAAEPDRADEVIYNLRAILLAVQADGLVRANENFMGWLRARRPCPLGRTGASRAPRDTTNPANNHLVVTTSGPAGRFG